MSDHVSSPESLAIDDMTSAELAGLVSARLKRHWDRKGERWFYQYTAFEGARFVVVYELECVVEKDLSVMALEALYGVDIDYEQKSYAGTTMVYLHVKRSGRAGRDG